MIRHKLALFVVIIVSLVALAVLVTACGGEEAPPAEPPAQASNPEPTDVPTQAPEPEPTDVPTQAPEPTAEPAQASEPTAEPTQAPEPTPEPTQAPEPTPEPTQAPEPTPAPTQAAGSSGGPTRIDLDAIFPPGRGRELTLGPCAACHNFVPIVILQLTPEQWNQVLRDHRERLPMVPEEDFLILEDYVVENFGPDSTVPELPQELLDQWTSY